MGLRTHSETYLCMLFALLSTIVCHSEVWDLEVSIIQLRKL